MEGRMRTLRQLVNRDGGMTTVEYIVGAAVVLGTLVVGVNSWNAGLVDKLESLVVQLQSVR
jgi:hypothetical protein